MGLIRNIRKWHIILKEETATKFRFLRWIGSLDALKFIAF